MKIYCLLPDARALVWFYLICRAAKVIRSSFHSLFPHSHAHKHTRSLTLQKVYLNRIRVCWCTVVLRWSEMASRATTVHFTHPGLDPGMRHRGSLSRRQVSRQPLSSILLPHSSYEHNQIFIMRGALPCFKWLQIFMGYTLFFKCCVKLPL